MDNIQILKLEEFKKQLKNKINDISADFAADYDNLGSSSYIDSSITEYADNYVDIYNSDLLEFLKNNPETVEEACEEFDYQGHDLCKMAAIGEFWDYERQVREDIDEIIQLLAVNYILNNKEVYNNIDIDILIDELAIIDECNRFEDILDVINELENKEG